MAKGDQVEVVLRGSGRIVVAAEKAGRKLVTANSKENGIAWILVHEQTWTNKIVKTSRFAASDVIAMISNFEESDG